MSQFALKNYWPSLVLTLVLLTGIGVCLRKLDCLAVEEIRALITIVFGSATSCLLLSLVWLIQKKPLTRPWPNQGLVLGRDTRPSMHPRGRPGSYDGHDENENDDDLDEQDDMIGGSSPSSFIGTISTLELERPPSYHDALAHSKPLDWHWPKKISPASADKRARTSLVNESAGQPRQDNIGHASERKISYIQLDVSQLILSSSPPKYNDLNFDIHHTSGPKI